MRSGELILESDPDYPQLYEALLRGMRIVGELNTSYHTPEQTREKISQLTGRQLDESTWIVPPFYTDFGQFIRLGKKVFINNGCTFMDRGGITLDDGVFIGPNVNIITENHAEEPELRHNVYCRPIHLKQNVWVGAAATILPGVTIGETPSSLPVPSLPGTFPPARSWRGCRRKSFGPSKPPRYESGPVPDGLRPRFDWLGMRAI